VLPAALKLLYLLGAALLLSLTVTNILEWKEIFELNEG
jgi:hypothetical protein